MKNRQKIFYLLLMHLLCIYGSTHEVVGDLNWQDLYMVNNSDYTLEVAANVTGISNINYVDRPQEHPVHLMKWVLPKRDTHSDGMIRLDKIDRLHNITIKPLVADVSQLPGWLQKAYPIAIEQRLQNKILMIYVGKTENRWLIDQHYVESVKIISGGPSGYSVEVDQP